MPLTPSRSHLIDVDYVLFGATGDLAFRKLLPALYNQFKKGVFSSKLRIIGVSRSDLSRDEYLLQIRRHFMHILPPQEFDGNLWAVFLQTIDYVCLESPYSGWNRLKELLAQRPSVEKIYYLSTPPQAFIPLTEKLAQENLLTPDSRLILEKPIGTSPQSSAEINDTIGQYLPEDRIYRIDHYLGKEAVQNLLVLRFANMAIGGLWNKDFIESVHITADETVGLEGRAEYYDKIGAARDMVQNHLLQLLALTAMRKPASLDATSIRDAKHRILQALRPLSEEDIENDTVRGQYAQGWLNGKHAPAYRDEMGRDTDTETFVQIKAHIDMPEWENVPFYLRTGKRLSKKSTSVILKFKRANDLFPSAQSNSLILHLDPYQGVKLYSNISSSDPNNPSKVELVPFTLENPTKGLLSDHAPPDAYERILHDIAVGNPALFIRRDEIKCCWDWIDPILKGWENGLSPLRFYAAGSSGPVGLGFEP